MSMANGNYEPQTTALIENIVEPGMVVIDVGAHVGYYTLLMARRIGGSGRIFAFEPEPENYRLLERNIELNGYSNITPVRKGVSDHSGYSTLFVAGLDNGRNSFFRTELPERGSLTVEITSLDEFLLLQQVDDVDLIKVDAEGSEMMIWNGMTKLIETSHKLKLIMEFNPVILRKAGLQPLDFLNMVGRFDYIVQHIHEGAGLQVIGESDMPEFAQGLETRGTSGNLFLERYS